MKTQFTKLIAGIALAGSMVLGPLSWMTASAHSTGSEIRTIRGCNHLGTQRARQACKSCIRHGARHYHPRARMCMRNGHRH